MSKNVLFNLFQVIQKDKEYENILIIGGGDLRIAQYVLKTFKNVKHLVNCEIDERVTILSEKYFGFDPIIKEAQE